MPIRKEFDEIYQQVGRGQLALYHKVAIRMLHLLNDLQDLTGLDDFDIDLMLISFAELLKRLREIKKREQLAKDKVTEFARGNDGS